MADGIARLSSIVFGKLKPVKREQTLRRRLRSQQILHEAVGAMKSLSAAQFRAARAALPPARDYESAVRDVLSAIGMSQQQPQGAPPAILLIASDLGLCDGYNSQLSAHALKEHAEREFAAVYCVGRRPVAALNRSGLEVTRLYHAPTSVRRITAILMTLAHDLLGEYLADRIGSLYVVSARFQGVGTFQPVTTQVLPIDALAGRPGVKVSGRRPDAASTLTNRQRASPAAEWRLDYVSRRRLLGVALREFLYITLYQLLIDALASEHSTRLVATEAAEEWLENRLTDTRRFLLAVHREAGTQELLDIVAGARKARRASP